MADGFDYQSFGLDPSSPQVTGIPNPSSTQITYGFGNDQFLTGPQQKIADSVQHAFANSLAQRDRDMQRYQMPQLSSFQEDEALARAIATANLANQPVSPFGTTGGGGGGGGGGRGGGGGGGGGGSARLPAITTGPRPTTPDPGASWRQFLSGASSLAPLLFGKDAFGNFMNRGLFGWVKDQFGNNVPVDQNGQPLVGGFQSETGLINPMTGMPMTLAPDYSNYYTQDLGTPIPTVDPWDVMGGANAYGLGSNGVVTTPYVDYGANIDWGGGGGWTDYGGGWGDWSGL